MTLHKGPVHHIGEAGVKLEYSNQMDVTPYNAPVIDEEIAANHQYLREFETFADCILRDKPFPVTVHDSRQTIAVVEALYYSAFNARKVQLPIQHKVDLAEIFGQLGQQKLRFKM